tara:strand:- start:167 stop:490 length:324 start_codon:yes stop_codon:yes gene_type:complete
MENAVISLAIVGNVCNLAYNVPFVYVVVKHRNADNISKYFLGLRLFSSIIWIMYGIFVSDMFVGISYSITLLSSVIVLAIKLTQKNSKEIEPNYRDQLSPNLREFYV